jgi:hypothetical protein
VLQGPAQADLCTVRPLLGQKEPAQAIGLPLFLRKALFAQLFRSGRQVLRVPTAQRLAQIGRERRIGPRVAPFVPEQAAVVSGDHRLEGQQSFRRQQQP